MRKSNLWPATLALSLCPLLTACAHHHAHGKPDPDEAIADTDLYKSLYSHDKDAVLRAVKYLSNQAGQPELLYDAPAKECRAVAKLDIAWLRKQDPEHLQHLDDGYRHFETLWSPYTTEDLAE